MSEGCSNHGCEFDPPKGMGTNGGCSCLKHIQPTLERIAVTTKVRSLKRRHDEVLKLANALLDYIDAIPEDIEFGIAMPGVDRDWVDSILGRD